MDNFKTKSLKGIEQKMKDLDENSLRYNILEKAKNFKTSWLELGQALYSAWKDKLFKDWGYGSFDLYTAREIGIKKQTAIKLLKSYYFLEKEEPGYLTRDYTESSDVSKIPGYEAINVLRLAKNKKLLDEKEYDNLKKDIFVNGKDAPQIRRDLTSLIRQREELEPEETRRRKKITTVKRFIGILKTLKEEIEASKLVPLSVIKDAVNLIRKLEEEIA